LPDVKIGIYKIKTCKKVKLFHHWGNNAKITTKLESFLTFTPEITIENFSIKTQKLLHIKSWYCIEVTLQGLEWFRLLYKVLEKR